MTSTKMLQLLLGSVVTRFLGAGIGLGTQLILTRSFLPEDVGIIFLAMSMAAILSVFVSGSNFHRSHRRDA